MVEIIRATENYAVAAGGFSNEATGFYSTVSGGRENRATGNYSLVTGGWFNSATGDYSFVSGGFSNIANADYSTAMGHDNNAVAYGETVIGLFNDSVAGQDKTGIIATDRLFTIGNGTSASNRSNALVMRKNGQTLIGEGNHLARLVTGSETGENPFAVYINNSLEGYWDDNSGLSIGNGTTPPPGGIYSEGNVTIGTTGPLAALTVDGDGTEDVVRFRDDGSTQFMIHADRSISVFSAINPADPGDMYINGFVGINTNDPDKELEVEGQALFSDAAQSCSGTIENTICGYVWRA